MKSVQNLCSQLNTYTLNGPGTNTVSNITADSREVQTNSLFICLPGAHVDGNTFIKQAVESGATAVLSEQAVEAPLSVAVIIVPDVRIAMQAITAYFYDYPAHKMRMIGVTGTNGKTTTTHIVGHILREAGYHVGIIGTVHILIDDESYPIHNTTPDVVDLQRVLFTMYNKGITHVVMEVSSHALAMNRVAGCEFDTAVFTNLTQDHLDYHKTFQNYLAAKAKLFQMVSAAGQNKTGKTAVVNIDDPYGQDILAVCTCPTITYSAQKEADLAAIDLRIQAKSSEFIINGSFGQIKLNMPITGLFNVYNTLAAIGAAQAEGVAIETILKGLASFHAVPGRFELVEEGQDFAVVVDYAHTPDGLENILTTAKALTKKRIIAVFGCGGDRDKTKRPIMGSLGAKYADVVVVTSDNPRTEDPEQIVAEVAAGVEAALRPGKKYEVIVDRRKAIERAIAIAQTGDIILIAGKGHENYQILKEKTIHFDDREVARQTLKER